MWIWSSQRHRSGNIRFCVFIERFHCIAAPETLSSPHKQSCNSYLPSLPRPSSMQVLKWMFLCCSLSCKWILSNCYNYTTKSKNVLPRSLFSITIMYRALTEEIREMHTAAKLKYCCFIQKDSKTLVQLHPEWHWHEVFSGYSISVHNNLWRFISLHNRK